MQKKEKQMHNSNYLYHYDQIYKSDLIKLGDSIEFDNIKKNRYISKPHQQYAIWIAENTGDFSQLPVYMRLAKYQELDLLTQAISYIKDYPNAKSKHKIFMWFLKGKLKKTKTPKNKNKLL